MTSGARYSRRRPVYRIHQKLAVLTYTTHPISSSDLPFLRQMLIEAAYWRPDANRPPPDQALDEPELAKLLHAWGRTGDAGVIARATDESPLGAAWYRFWSDDDHSWGYVSADVPELAIGVNREARRQGVGGALLVALFRLASERDVPRISLSVEKDNPAVALYERHGFRPVDTVGNAWTMIADVL